MNQDPMTSHLIQEVPIEQRISFRLQRIGTLLTTQAVGLLRDAGGLTLNQWRLLSFVGERVSGSVHELARLGNIDKATLSRAANELQKRELVVSETSKSDRRAAILKLTGKGRQLMNEVAPTMIARQSELMGALTEAERESLYQSLDKLEATISQSKLGLT